MPLYDYKVILRDGKMDSGTVELADKQEVLTYLEELNMIPVAINEKRAGIFQYATLSTLISKRTAGKKPPIIDITNGIAMLLRAGLSLDRALKSMARATQNKQARAFLLDIEAEIREGRSFSSALEKRRDIVGDLYISMVRAGEVTGKLAECMTHLAKHLEQSRALREDLVTAMVYPLVLLVVTAISIILLMVMVMPRFKQLFQEMGGEVPAVTQLFIDISDLLANHGMTGLGIVLILLLIVNAVKKSEASSIWLDRKILALPWYGKLQEKLQMTRFAQTLALLLKNGVSIQNSIRISRGVLSNRYIEADIRNREQELSEGASFSNTVGQCFPLLTREMIRIGEEASELENTLLYVAEVAQQEVERSIKRVLGLLEPLIIVLLGLVVAAVIGSIMVAVLSMNDLVVI
ncbi:MAG: type II secretion system F family protein [Gammaproteobacteria bacterium]|nr:type II secretion system F family protein [Gammaproteobacteria bacterium]MDH5652919.1 type II secretion system F family protein [Gammaproteobacteria bacterium]